MSFVSTLDTAREFLLLEPEIEPAGVLQAARDRYAELHAKSADSKATLIGRQGAVRKLKELTLLLPVLEIEAELAVLESASAATAGPQIHKLRLEQKKLAERAAALPAGDERTIFSERLHAVHEALHPKQPPPDPVIPPDPAVAAFAEKLTSLRTAIDQKETNKLRLSGLLAEARGVASVLRDDGDRRQSAAQLEDLVRIVDTLVASAVATPPPLALDPTEKIIAEKIHALRTAVEKKDRSRAPFLLDSARDLASVLRVPAARASAESELAELAASVEKLLAPPPPDPAEERFTEKLATLRTALASGDLPVAATLLAEARTVAATIQSVDVRVGRESEVADAAAQLSRLETETRDRAQLAAVTDKIGAARQAFDRADWPAVQQCLAEARRLAEEMSARGERDATLAQVAKLTAVAKIKEELYDVQQAITRGDAPAAQRRFAAIRLLAADIQDRSEREATVADLEKLAANAEVLAARNRPTKPAPGLVLRLLPKAGTAFTGTVPPPLRFVARPRFLLGKELLQSSSLADFLAPNSFGPVGRVQAVLSIRDDEILIQDGNGEKKSVNGTKLDDESLAPSPVPASFTRDRTLLLATVFELTARHVPGEAPGGPPLSDALQQSINRTVVIKNITGAMRFLAKGDLPLPVFAVWLFTDATIGTAPACAVPLPGSGLADLHARVHHWQDGFWIENLRSGVAVRLGDHPLAKGEALPLRHGDALTLGNITYDVHVEN